MEPKEQELQEIVALYCTCFNGPDKRENWTFDTAYQYFQDRIAENSIVITIRDKQQLVGVTSGSDYQSSYICKETGFNYDNCFYISLTAIDPAYRHQGYGQTIKNIPFHFSNKWDLKPF